MKRDPNCPGCMADPRNSCGHVASYELPFSSPLLKAPEAWRFVVYTEASPVLSPSTAYKLSMGILQPGRLLRLRLDTFARIATQEIHIVGRSLMTQPSGESDPRDLSGYAGGLSKRGLASLDFHHEVRPGMQIDVLLKHCGKKPACVILVGEFEEIRW